jgi:Flp pilus assembly protein TadG
VTARAVGDDGQAAVEVALVLPLLALLALALVQVGLVVRDQVLVIHAAREGARAAAVDDRPGAARDGAVHAAGLDPGRLAVTATVSPRGGQGARVKVQVTYRSRTDVPLVGPMIGDLELRGTATMRVEE